MFFEIVVLVLFLFAFKMTGKGLRILLSSSFAQSKYFGNVVIICLQIDFKYMLA